MIMWRGGERARALSLAILLVLAAVVPKMSAEAQQSDNGGVTQNPVFRLGEIDVVGRVPENGNPAKQAVTSSQMRLFNRNNVATALDLLPGVTLSETGARNETTVYIRGFDTKHVPIFLDGIPIYVPYDGYPDLALYNTYDLSKVTVSKGFASVLFGPNTMGGAVNMITRKPVKPLEMNAGAGYASGNTYHGYVNFGSNQGKWFIQGGGSYINRDYFRLSDDFSPTPYQGKGRRINSYYSEWNYNVKLGWTPNETDEYAISIRDLQAEKGVPPYAGTDPSVMERFWQWPDWENRSIYFMSNTSILDKNYLKTRLFYDTYDNSLYSYDNETYSTMKRRYAFKSFYHDYTYGGSLEFGSQLLPKNFIKASFHYKDDVHREHDAGNPVQRFEDRITSIGLQDTVDFTEQLYSILGISYDHVNTVQAQNLDAATNTLTSFPLGAAHSINPQGGLFYKLTPTGTLYATIARKSRLPTIKDKFSYRLGTALPNPDLKPEKSINYQLGYKDLLFDRIHVEATLFYNDINDFILLARIPNPDSPGKTIEQNQNVGHVNQYGLELDVSGQILSYLKGGVNYTYLQYSNKSSHDKLIDIPHNKVFAYLQYFTPLKGLSLLGSVEYNSDRYSSSNGVEVARAYAVVNTKAIYSAYKGFSIEGGINNITDEDYSLDEGYPLPGRNYFVNLRYTF